MSSPEAVSSLARVRVFARLELAEALRSRWLAFTALVYALVFGAFVWLGLRESSVLGFTGLSRVVLNVSNAVVVAVPLVALVATCQGVVKARSSGQLELLLTQPARRVEWFAGLVLSRLVVLLGPLVVLLVGASVVGTWLDPADTALVHMSARALALAGGLLWAFVGLGLLLSAFARTAERAVVSALLAWLVTAALHDFGLIALLLQAEVEPRVVFWLAALNPVEAARIAVLGAVDPELSVLGPVGFWIANALGPVNTFTLGVGWPLVLGSVALLGAARRVGKGDVV